MIPSVSIKRGSWIVVCDGRKALIYENVGRGHMPELELREQTSAENPKASEHGTDRPGRVYQSTGSRRSSVEQTDRHVEMEKEFLRGIIARLDKAVLGGEAEDIYIVAAPRALGILRSGLTPRLKAAVRGEVDKDLVSLPAEEILSHIVA